jgi:hypothetical protein
MRERGLWAGLSNVFRIEFSLINASIMLCLREELYADTTPWFASARSLAQ